MERLLKKFATAATLVPQPVLRPAAEKTKLGVIYFGSTSPSMHEALQALEERGIHLDALRLRAFPFPDSVVQFLAQHEKVFVVEQNRDAQMRSLLVNELDADPARLIRVLHFDGTPITARFIVQSISAHVQQQTQASGSTDTKEPA
jgi:2-oxoglutarate ferredoxin oxidoreductase subunit alpha